MQRALRAIGKELRVNTEQSTIMESIATWTDRGGKKQTAVVFDADDGSKRVRVVSTTYYAKYRDGNGLVQEIPTGCRDVQAARTKLAELEKTAERVRSGVLSSNDCKVIEHQDTSSTEHLDAYVVALRVAGRSGRHIDDTKRLAQTVATECEFRTLRDIDADEVEKWLHRKATSGLAPRTRNSYLQALKGFCSWCVDSNRLLQNPLARLKKIDESTDCRRKRGSISKDRPTSDAA